MSILSGWLKTRAYRKTTDGYKKESRDTSSETVFMNDGNTAETNLGDIKGITDSLTATSSNVALSAKGGNNLQGQIDTLNSNLNNKSNTWTKLYSGNTLMNTGTSVNLTDMIANYTEIRFVYRYADTGYFYTRDFFNTGSTTYWVIEATLADASKVFSMFNRQENQGNKLTCAQAGSASGVYLYEVWGR